MTRRHLRHAFYALCRLASAEGLSALTAVRYFDVPDISRAGGLIIASNHQSYLDPPLVSVSIDWPLNFLAQDGLFRVPGFGTVIRLLGAHPLKRGQADRQAIKAAMEVLRAGEALIVFPEGTRTQDGRISPFKPGVGAIALRCGVPILPACVEGAFECWPRSRVLPWPGRVAVAYGTMVRPEGMDAQRMTLAVEQQVRLLQQRLRSYLGRPEILEVTERSDSSG